MLLSRHWSSCVLLPSTCNHCLCCHWLARIWFCWGILPTCLVTFFLPSCPPCIPLPIVYFPWSIGATLPLQSWVCLTVHAFYQLIYLCLNLFCLNLFLLLISQFGRSAFFEFWMMFFHLLSNLFNQHLLLWFPPLNLFFPDWLYLIVFLDVNFDPLNFWIWNPVLTLNSAKTYPSYPSTIVLYYLTLYVNKFQFGRYLLLILQFWCLCL